uniref:Protein DETOXIFICATION n=1 Tax=Oryza barthii TaxID=65489 RepID=A0A0D3FRM2_9ORYZ
MTPPPPSPPHERKTWAESVASEFRAQRGIAFPLIAMNLTWFAKLAVTTAFLGRLGDLQLAAGTLGFSFANVTGFAVLTGLCAAMDPICGQAHGASNGKLLRKTLVMATILLLGASIPIAFLWLHVDAVLLRFGQQADMSSNARSYVVCLLPDLAVTSFVNPLKSTRGIQGVATAVWVSDLAVAVMLAGYVLVSERRRKAGGGGGWVEQTRGEWVRLLRLAVPSCLNTCLEWWCYEILVLLTGRLPDARRTVAVMAVTLNFDYLLFAGMLSLSVSASVRVSNELGAGEAWAARRAGMVSIVGGAVGGVGGGVAMVAARRAWGSIYSSDAGVREGVGRAMEVMAVLEVVNFPLNVCGGIVRGTARPAVGMYAVVAGFYVLALPLGVALAFKARLGIQGLLLGFLVGAAASLAVLLTFIARMDWPAEAQKARTRTTATVAQFHQHDEVVQP